MAIKGKKRSRNRGSQGIRRPAAAPRPTVAAKRKQHWYQSPLTVGVVAIFGLVLVGILIALIVDIQARSSETGDRREVLETYSDDVRAPLELATSAVSQMSQLTTPPRGEALDTLSEDAASWVAEIQNAQTQLAPLGIDAEIQEVNQLFNEALALYVSAANTFATLPDISDADVREAVFTQAAGVRDTATALFESAISVLDQLRDGVDLGSSGLRAPTIMQQPPAEEPETGSEEGGGGGAGEEGDAEGGGGGG